MKRAMTILIERIEKTAPGWPAVAGHDNMELLRTSRPNAATIAREHGLRFGGGAMRFVFAALLAATIVTPARAEEEKGALLPLVGCAQYNTWGMQAAPRDDFRRATHIDPADAGRLAWYQTDENQYIVAPRGWHCIEVRDHDAIFIVSEERYSLEDFRARKPIIGPAVVRFQIDGSWKRRRDVARAASRYFPRIFPGLIARAGVKRLAPYPGDVPLYRYDINHDVVYETQANHQGLGTEDLLVPGPLPIETALYIAGSEDDDPGLTKVVVRLPAGWQDLAISILQQTAGPLFPSKFLPKP
jgi:hypothetical protein